MKYLDVLYWTFICILLGLATSLIFVNNKTKREIATLNEQLSEKTEYINSYYDFNDIDFKYPYYRIIIQGSINKVNYRSVDTIGVTENRFGRLPYFDGTFMIRKGYIFNNVLISEY